MLHAKQKELSPSAKRLGFYIHALAFVVIVPLLIVINLITGSYYWFLWVLLGWSLGLLAHWWFGIRTLTTRKETAQES